jgi:serine/threonine-protein kinase
VKPPSYVSGPGSRRAASLIDPGTILGSYRITQPLGQGAMGVVYLAEHVKLGRRVALKVLRSELADDSTLVSRFFGEAKAVNQIAHENIVEVTDFVEDGEGHAYYIMELLRGQTLGEVLATEGALWPRRAVGIAVQICNAMAAVHDAGIVHRDLKPENIFLVERAGRADFVKILDFGVAKLAEAEAGAVKKTASGTMLGTPQYMSPEQAAGRDVDRRTDIYSLGVILYELLTGRCPFEAKTIGEVIVKHMSLAPPPPSRLMQLPRPLPGPVVSVVMRCLEKPPAKRPQSMGELEAALRAAAVESGFPIETYSSALPRRRRLRTRLAMGAAAVAIVAAAAVAGWLVSAGGGDAASSARPKLPRAARTIVAPATNGPAAHAPAESAAPATALPATPEPASASAAPATAKPTGKRGKGKDDKAGAASATPKKEDRSGTLDPFRKK